MAKESENGSKVERAVVAMTALAMNCPSTFTIAWSKEQHKDQLPVLYAGVGTSLITVLGAVLGKRFCGDLIMWAGLLGSLGLFGYISFFYNPNSTCNNNTTIIKVPPTESVIVNGNVVMI